MRGMSEQQTSTYTKLFECTITHHTYTDIHSERKRDRRSYIYIEREILGGISRGETSVLPVVGVTMRYTLKESTHTPAYIRGHLHTRRWEDSRLPITLLS